MTAVQEEFRESECGGNLPIGWVLWRVYAVNIPGYYKPVLIKKSDSDETKCYRVYEEWLLASVHNIVLFCKMCAIAYCTYCIMALNNKLSSRI